MGNCLQMHFFSIQLSTSFNSLTSKKVVEVLRFCVLLYIFSSKIEECAYVFVISYSRWYMFASFDWQMFPGCVLSLIVLFFCWWVTNVLKRPHGDVTHVLKHSLAVSFSVFIFLPLFVWGKTWWALSLFLPLSSHDHKCIPMWFLCFLQFFFFFFFFPVA